MDNIELIAIAVANITIDNLTDDELLALNICAQLDTDPRQVMGYERLGHALFTDNSSTYPRVHDLTRQALSMAMDERFG